MSKPLFKDCLSWHGFFKWILRLVAVLGIIGICFYALTDFKNPEANPYKVATIGTLTTALTTCACWPHKPSENKKQEDKNG